MTEPGVYTDNQVNECNWDVTPTTEGSSRCNLIHVDKGGLRAHPVSLRRGDRFLRLPGFCSKEGIHEDTGRIVLLRRCLLSGDDCLPRANLHHSRKFPQDRWLFPWCCSHPGR